MEGWVSLHRKIIDNEIWQRPVYLRLFLYLLLNACHNSKTIEYKEKGQIIKIGLERGQLLKSIRKIQEDTIYIENNKIKIPALSSIEYILNYFSSLDIIKREQKGLCTLITIVNYNLYQEKKSGYVQALNNNNNVNNKQVDSSNSCKNNKLAREILENITLTKEEYGRLYSRVVGFGCKNDEQVRAYLANKIEDLSRDKKKGVTFHTKDYNVLLGAINKDYRDDKSRILVINSKTENTDQWNLMG